jgi:S1-C subfamily serine protease
MKQGSGSAFFISGNMLVTCNHVVTAGTPLGITQADGSRREVSIVATDPGADLILLRVAGSPQAFARLSDRDPVIGEHLWVASKFGVSQAVMDHFDPDPEVGRVMIVSTTGHGVGASGAAVLDISGSVVGVLCGAVDTDGRQCVAVPVARLRTLASHKTRASDSPGAP